MDKDFNRIFDLYSDDIYRLIYSYTLNMQEAKDLTQETFIKLYKHINLLPKEEIEIKKWLIRVAINNCKNYFKTFWKTKVTTIDYNKLTTYYKDNYSFEYQELLNQLEKKYRIPIYLYYYEGYKVEEIAKILHLSVSSIKMRLKRAKEVLKKEMLKEYE